MALLYSPNNWSVFHPHILPVPTTRVSSLFFAFTPRRSCEAEATLAAVPTLAERRGGGRGRRGGRGRLVLPMVAAGRPVERNNKPLYHPWGRLFIYCHAWVIFFNGMLMVNITYMYTVHVWLTAPSKKHKIRSLLLVFFFLMSFHKASCGNVVVFSTALGRGNVKNRVGGKQINL